MALVTAQSRRCVWRRRRRAERSRRREAKARRFYLYAAPLALRLSALVTLVAATK
jgi:hypothetical protein